MLNKIIHVVSPSHEVSHLFRGLFHLIHLLLLMWHPLCDVAS